MAWMGFTMPVWKKAMSPLRALMALLAFALLFHLSPAEANGILIQKAQIERRDGKNFISADIEYHFPEVALKALDEGIPLTFSFIFTLDRDLPFGLAWPLYKIERSVQIRYLPLAKSYQVADLGSGAVQGFASLVAVLQTLERIRGWEVDLNALPSDRSFMASLAFRFDIEALPLPLRIEAYVAPAWHMQNGSYRWQLPP